jgi:hypothetical protein
MLSDIKGWELLIMFAMMVAVVLVIVVIVVVAVKAASGSRTQTPTVAQQPVPPPPGAVPAGWYPDPSTTGGRRYWDGSGWTEHTAPGS